MAFYRTFINDQKILTPDLGGVAKTPPRPRRKKLRQKVQTIGILGNTGSVAKTSITFDYGVLSLIFATPSKYCMPLIRYCYYRKSP